MRKSTATKGRIFFAVGMPVTRHPPHRSQRAELPHWAPTSGDDAHALPPTVCVPAHVAGVPGSVSGSWFAGAHSPWPAPFPPLPPQAAAHHCPCSEASQVLWGCQTSHIRSLLSYSLRIHSTDRGTIALGQTWDLPAPAQGAYVRAWGLRPRRVQTHLAIPIRLISPSAHKNNVGTPKGSFAAQ
jgi:hypothetical protein